MSKRKNYFEVHKNKKPRLKSRNKRFVDLKRFISWCEKFSDATQRAAESLQNMIVKNQPIPNYKKATS